ncbi:hypothetical protein GCM10023170_086640 [Phytohabitans houttuyneae]|uniref:Uncharacterized protein n=1 Tax=Phytohabitans houttuyneae TaxID=1076126 RepID=A0A6V8K2V0_9ACTN|nr:hypothetical protein Phou_006790 [Phytohabitans houttuyneae]
MTGLTTRDAVLSGPRRHLTPGRHSLTPGAPTRPRDPGPLRTSLPARVLLFSRVGLPHNPLGLSPTYSTVLARLDGRAVSRLSSWAHRCAHVRKPALTTPDVSGKGHRPKFP